MPKDLNIYVQTASNADESSFATYCNGMEESPPDAFPCLGDLYSVAWMEDRFLSLSFFFPLSLSCWYVFMSLLLCVKFYPVKLTI